MDTSMKKLLWNVGKVLAAKYYRKVWGEYQDPRIKKKLKSSLGDIVVPNKHPVSRSANHFRMTSYLQDNVCFIGQKDTFEEGSETIQRLMGIDVSNKQIQKVSEHYGQCLEESTLQQIGEENAEYLPDQDTAKTVYGMCDGSMVLTREEAWKEIKLGRVFKAEDNLVLS